MITTETHRQYPAEYWMGFRWNFLGGFDALDAAIEAATRHHNLYNHPVRVRDAHSTADHPFALGAFDPYERSDVYV